MKINENCLPIILILRPFKHICAVLDSKSAVLKWKMCSTKICCNKCNVFKKAQYLYVPKLTYLIRIKLQNLQLAGIIILINQSVYTLHVHTCSQKPLPYQLHHFHYADVSFNSIWCYCNLQDLHHEWNNLHHQHRDQPIRS